MTKNRKTSGFRDFTSYKWALEQAKTGNRVIYLQEAQYPLLEVQVILRERSREQMGHLELTILKLLQISPLQPGALAALLGFSEARLYNLVKELQGRSLIGYTLGELGLTRLGMMSVEHGHEVVEVKRALLLCGITGRLMPAATYEQQLDTVEKLGAYNPVLIDGTQNVPCTNLDDIAQLQDKRAYNLPDEAMEVVEITDYEPKFLRGTLALYKSPDKKVQSEFCFADRTIDWLAEHQLISFVEPIEWRYKGRKDKTAILAEICDSLHQIGCTVVHSEYDADGNPVVKLGAMTDSALKETIHPGARYQLAFFVGTSQHQAVPTIRFPQKGDLLSGHPLSLEAVDETLQKEINLLREASDAMDAYYETAFDRREGSVQEHVLTALTSAGYSWEELNTLVQRLGLLRRFSSLLK